MGVQAKQLGIYIALADKPDLRVLTILLKALSINIVLVFNINANSVQVSYTYNHRTIDHIEYKGSGGIQRTGSKHQYAITRGCVYKSDEHKMKDYDEIFFQSPVQVESATPACKQALSYR